MGRKQMGQESVVLMTEMPDVDIPRRGKVRDIYDLGELLLLVASDRISAFDVVLPNGIPGKGKVVQADGRYCKKSHCGN